MKSHSDRNFTVENEKQQKIEQHINEVLDQSVARLPNETLTDIARVRNIALRKMNKQAQPTSMLERFKEVMVLPVTQVAMPVALAVIVGILVNYHSPEEIPALPVAMVTADIPGEDLTLLEDLDFVTWLAENEQEVLL